MSTANSHSDTPPSTDEAQHRPKRVQWASKTRVEHVEKAPDVQVDDEPRSLDEHAQDPKALSRLHHALEPYQQAGPSEPASLADTNPTEHHPQHQDLDERVYVAAGETAGLPQPISTNVHNPGADIEQEVLEQRRAEESLWDSRASELVRAHTSRGRRAATRITETAARAVSPNTWRFTRRGSDDEKRPSEDLEANTVQASHHIAPLPLGPRRGVLSALLALYDSHSSNGSSTTNSSAANSGTSTPETAPRIEEDKPTASQPRSHSKTLPKFHIPLPTPALNLSSTAVSGRPKAARNAGGVVGSLIATSGNIMGAAAPAPSSVGPNVRRSGWRLTRYELAPEDTLHRRMHSAPSTPLQNPRADYFGSENDSATGTITSTPTQTRSHTPVEPPPQSRRSTWDWFSHATTGETESGRSSPAFWSSKRGTTPPTDQDDSSSIHRLDGNGDGKAYRRCRKDRRRKAEIFITKHVAEIMQRQEFLLKLARALMMFAAPTHRLQAQIQATARVLDLETSSLYLPNVLLLSFGDEVTGTSNLKFIQQASSLDLGKLLDAHRLYWKVIHDEISVSSASASLDFLMRIPPLYRGWHVVLIGGLCSAAICPLAFSGSFIDSLMAMPLGALLVFVQNLSTRNELYTNVFEITIATLLSFISAGLASTSHFCYAALASSSVVLILPGFFVLSGSLELASRQIVSGAVRICFAVIYSLFLGFGLAMGADVYSRITHLPVVGPDDFRCTSSHRADGPWWQRTASIWWAFLCVPLYSLALSIRNQAPLLRKELPITILISSAGWAANHFSGLAFPARPDIQSAVGAFAVGIVANVYARFFKGNAYVVMITGILFQLPSGLANGGLLTFAAVDNQGQQFQSYQSGFQVALQLVAVAIGLTVGLFTSVVVVHPLGGSRRSAAGLFSL